jgi:hypothetical protein
MEGNGQGGPGVHTYQGQDQLGLADIKCIDSNSDQ